VDISGAIERDGVALLTGATSIPDRYGPGGERVLDISFQIEQVTQTTMSGSLRYTLTGEFGTETRSGPILFASRGEKVTPELLRGTWRGYARRKQCAGDCGSWDPLLPFYALNLLISQSGADVAGALNGLQFDGSVSGASLLVNGRYEIPNCKPGFEENVCLLEVSDFSGTVDSLGRMHGSFNYRAEGFDSSHRHFAFSAAAELVGVGRWP
jgi:hypothetical protein